MSYTIIFSNTNKPNIIVNDNTINNTSLSIQLYGKGVENWGQTYQQNLVQMLENFDSNTSPIHPTNGQLYHKRSYTNNDHQLQVFHMGNWCDVLLLNTSQPSQPFPGQLWFDGSNNYKFRNSSNTAWNLLTDGTLLLTGGTLTGNVVLSVAPTLSNHLTTKGYVDSSVSSFSTSLSNKVNKAGDTMTGLLTLSADPTNA